jgi:hypothetical protein
MHDDIATRVEDAARAVSSDHPDLRWVMERGRRLRKRRLARAAVIGVASAAVVAMSVSAVIGARDRDPTEIGVLPPEESTSPKDQATNYGRLVLPDDELVAAVPEGFELEQIVRNDQQFERDGWVTVGVRLIPEDITYARVIFYVLPDERSADQLYREQSGQTRSSSDYLDGPKPRAVDGVDPSTCGGHIDGLWTCHTVDGRFYVVTQSGDYPGARELDPEGRAYGEMLLRAFAAVIDE